MFILPCTQDQFNKLLVELENCGVSVNSYSNGYHIDGHGVEAIATFSNNELRVVVSKKPFFVSVAHIKEALYESLNAK